MAVRQPLVLKQRGTGRRGEVYITGTILIGAAGAVTSFVCEFCSTTGIVKNAAAGRYDITFMRKYKNIRLVSALMNGPQSAAFTNADGNLVLGRTATANASMTLQAVVASTSVDTNPTSGSTITFEAVGQEL